MTNVAELECKSRGCQGLGSGWGSCLEGTEFQTSKLKWSGDGVQKNVIIPDGTELHSQKWLGG